MIFIFTISFLFISLITSSPAAANGGLHFLLNKADTFLQKEDLQSLQEALTLYRSVLENDAKNYNALIGTAQSLYLLGNKQKKKNNKKETFTQCITYMKQAIALEGNRVEAHYWCGLCYGKYAETAGILAGASMVSDIKKEMETVLSIDPSYSHGGAYRVLGRIYYSLPWVMGGNKKKSLSYLKSAIKHDPAYLLNHLYLADTYIALGEKKLAEEELKQILSTKKSQTTLFDDTIPLKQFAQKKLNELLKK